MKKRNRLVSILLALVMCLGMLPLETFAQEYSSNDFVIEDGVLVEYRGSGGDVVIPDGVTEICNNVFNGDKRITSVTIPDSVTKISSYAFIRCESLASVRLPENLGTIEFSTFSQCSSLSEIVFPKNLRVICSYAFAWCSSLTEVNIPEGTVTIEESAFSRCTNLKRVSIPNSVKNLDYAAFRMTPWLEAQRDDNGFIIIDNKLVQYVGPGGDVVIPDGVTQIEMNAFTGKQKAISNLTVPAGMESTISLADWENLERVTLKGKTNIGSVTGCYSLADIIPVENILSIESDGLKDTLWLENQYDDNGFAVVNGMLLGYRGPGGDVVIPNSVTKIVGPVFEGNTSITSLTIPDSVVQLSIGMCYGCENIITLELGRGITEIPQSAFAQLTRLEDITIPNSVTRIYLNAFASCKRLRNVTFEAPTALKDYEFLRGFFQTTLIEQPTEFWATFYQNMQSVWANPNQLMEPQSERIVALSNQITAGCKTDYEKVKAIHDWVHENIAYDYDYYTYHKKPLFEVTLNPEEVLDSRLTICEGYTRLVQALLLAQEIPVYYVSGWSGNNAHAWNEVYADGRWFFLDATWGLDYFDIPVYEFAKNHIMGYREWEEEGIGDILREANTPSQWAQSEVWDAIWTNKLIPYDLQADYRANITREDFCRIMIALVEKVTGKTKEEYIASKGLTLTHPFTDTDNEAVLAAYALGIVNGTSATTFAPDGSITRQEAAAMLARTAKVLGMTTGESMRFTDTETLDDWAKESIAFVSGLTDPTSGNRVMGGVGANMFDPFGTYTREQAILTTLRFFNCK